MICFVVDSMSVTIAHFDMEQVFALLQFGHFLFLKDRTTYKGSKEFDIIEKLFHNIYLIFRQRDFRAGLLVDDTKMGAISCQFDSLTLQVLHICFVDTIIFSNKHQALIPKEFVALMVVYSFDAVGTFSDICLRNTVFVLAQ